MLNQDVLKEFIFDAKMKKLSERTIKGYKNNNLRFFRYIEQEYQIIELEDTYPQAIKGYISYLSSLGRKETYINGIIKTMRAYFTYVMNEGYLRKNPMDKIKFQKEPIPLITTFNDDEVVRMLKYFNGARFLDVRNKLLMTLLFDTGLRNSELCNLKVSDIRETYIFVNGKGKKQRVVPISPILNKQIIKYNRVRMLYIKDKFAYQTEYYILSQKGRKLTVETLERIVKDCGEACNVRKGIRISPHTCRHYFAQAQLKNGCDLYTLSRLMGHNNPNVTKIYLRSMKDDDFLDMAVGTSPLMNL